MVTACPWRSPPDHRGCVWVCVTDTCVSGCFVRTSGSLWALGGGLLYLIVDRVPARTVISGTLLSICCRQKTESNIHVTWAYCKNAWGFYSSHLEAENSENESALNPKLCGITCRNLQICILVRSFGHPDYGLGKTGFFLFSFPFIFLFFLKKSKNILLLLCNRLLPQWHPCILCLARKQNRLLCLVTDLSVVWPRAMLRFLSHLYCCSSNEECSEDDKCVLSRYVASFSLWIPSFFPFPFPTLLLLVRNQVNRYRM